MHRIWRIQTTQGDFAVKQFNREIRRKPDVRDRYRLTERIAAAMAAQGVPAVTALSRDNGPVQDFGGISALVFPWINGTTLPPGPAEPAQAGQIGAILGTMRALHLDIPGLEIPIAALFERRCSIE